jgi:hypothetical protein
LCRGEERRGEGGEGRGGTYQIISEMIGVKSLQTTVPVIVAYLFIVA